MLKLPLTFALLTSFSFFAYSQSDSSHLAGIAGKLAKMSAASPVEKVYLHLNKPVYLIDDTVWFKAYTVAGVHHQPSALSGVVYVELWNDKGKLLKSHILQNDNGISAGDFSLDQLVPGNYHIRAYTNWMRNQGPEYFFDAAFYVGDVSVNTLNVTTSLAFSVNGMADTKLSYTDRSGKPFSGRQVNYEVRADSNLLYTGKGVTDGNGNISFSFPDKTAPGQRITAISHLKVVNGTVIDKTIPLNIVNENMDIQFFPEGGTLVNGVRSRVAFKAIGSSGLGVDVTGIITDNDNNEVAEFSSQHLGMGVFAFLPQQGKSYLAKITAGNYTTTVKLPQAADKGFVLAVNNNPGDSTKLNVRISTNEATLQEKKGQSFYITAQSGGDVYYTTAGKLNDASFTAVVPKNKFPSGITQFTLFAANNEPLDERVVFINNSSDILDLMIRSDKNAYQPNEKVKVDITANDNAHKPVQGNFSLSVYNEDENVPGNNENTILSTLLLTADLKGYVEQPGYYFRSGAQPGADLDILMLTQGYRRFSWKDVLSDTHPNIAFKPEKGLSLSGTLTTSSGKPVAKGKISLIWTEAKTVADTTSDAQGRFRFTDLGYPDTTKLLLQARTAGGGKDVTIKLDRNQTAPLVYKPVMMDIQNAPPVLADAERAADNKAIPADTVQTALDIKNFERSVKGRRLDEVTIKEHMVNSNQNAPWMPVVNQSANLNGPGHADQVLGTKDLQDCLDLFDCMINRIPGILRSPTGDRDSYQFSKHATQSISHPVFIKYLLNGLFVSGDLLSDVLVNDVATIEVLKSGVFLNIYGTQASGGMIIITTKTGTFDPNEDYNAQVAPGVTTTKFYGYNRVREFYVPKFAPKNVDDERTAVYWDPNVATDTNGKFSAEYFNSSIKGNYRAVIEGIDNDGNIGRYVYTYKVN